MVEASHLDRDGEGGAIGVGVVIVGHTPDHRPLPLEVPRVVHLSTQLSRVPAGRCTPFALGMSSQLWHTRWMW